MYSLFLCFLCFLTLTFCISVFLYICAVYGVCPYFFIRAITTKSWKNIDNLFDPLKHGGGGDLYASPPPVAFPLTINPTHSGILMLTIGEGVVITYLHSIYM